MRALKLWIPVIAWMALIFVFSTDLFSGSNTSSLLRPLLLWLVPSSTPEQLDGIQWVLRKFGHLTEYAVLALLLLRAVVGQFPAWSIDRQSLASLAAAVLYAASDEWHQSFVPSRSASIYDMLIDSAGALCAILWRRSFSPMKR
jgi:VanZ family protein